MFITTHETQANLLSNQMLANITLKLQILEQDNVSNLKINIETMITF